MKTTFEVNGVDLAALCSKRGYSTARVPVYGKSVTTLDGVTHTRLLRWRNSVTVTLNDLTDEEVALFCAAITDSTLTVRFFSAQLGAVVENTMTVATGGVTSPFLLQHRTARYWSGRAVTFEQA